MNARSIWAGLFALLALACEPTFTVAAREGLEADTLIAVNAWNDALRGACPVQLTYVDDWDGADLQVAYGAVPGYDDGMVASATGHFIVVHPEGARAWPTTIPAVLVHEIGHALGATHSDDPRDIMYGGGLDDDRSPTPTAADVARVCEARRPKR